VREGDGWKFRKVQLDSHFWTPYEDGWSRTPFIQRG